ncbi:MAG: DUF4142 domain-containing protein [Gemmatimonadaceae bacterium]
MKILLISAAALALGGTLSLSTGASTPASAPVPVASVVSPSTAIDDPTIVAIFDWASSAEFETSGMGAARAHDKDVRALARQLVRDHRAVQKQGRALARKLHVKVPHLANKDNPLYEQHVATLKALRHAKKGADFDRVYLQHEVDYHKAVIDAVTNQFLPAIQNAELKDFVTKVAPAFKAHQDAAQNLLDKMKS